MKKIVVVASILATFASGISVAFASVAPWQTNSNSWQVSSNAWQTSSTPEWQQHTPVSAPSVTFLSDNKNNNVGVPVTTNVYDNGLLVSSTTVTNYGSTSVSNVPSFDYGAFQGFDFSMLK